MAIIDEKSIHKRFKETLKHDRLGKPMVDYMAERDTDRRLREELGCNSEEELLDALGVEFFYLPGRDISQNEGFVPYYRGAELHQSSDQRVCPFGITFTRGAYDSKFSVDEALDGPLRSAESPRDIINHRWPRRQDFDFGSLIDIAEAHAHRVLIGGLWTGILGDAVRLYGYERFLTDLALDPDIVHTLIDTLTDVYIDLNDMVFEQLRGRLDVFFFGNDFGSQQSLLMSKEMWMEFYFHNISRLCDLAHSYGLAVMMHSCGAVSELIEPLVEAGVDILDPVQTSAHEMTPGALATKFGGRVVFHGGIDTQHVLPSATQREVADHVSDIVSTFGNAGGYIASGSQLFGPDIPVENLLTIYRELGAEEI